MRFIYIFVSTPVQFNRKKIYNGIIDFLLNKVVLSKMFKLYY